VLIYLCLLCSLRSIKPCFGVEKGKLAFLFQLLILESMCIELLLCFLDCKIVLLFASYQPAKSGWSNRLVRLPDWLRVTLTKTARLKNRIDWLLVEAREINMIVNSKCRA
jgi:hypothetical protein